MTQFRLRYVQSFRDRHGVMRHYYRRGHRQTPLPGQPGDAEFMAAYWAAEGMSTRKARLASPRATEGTFDALAVMYYKSPKFSSLSAASQRNYRRIIDRWRSEHGHKRVSHLSKTHVLAHLAARKDDAGPEGANGLRKVLKILCKLAVQLEWRPTDPTNGVGKYRSSGKGFEAWSEADIDAFLNCWGEGTRERLALFLLLYLGQRRGDTVRMGWQHISGDTIIVEQQKTGVRLIIPIHRELMGALDATPKTNLSFIVTSFGSPFTPAGFGNWFRTACDKAGLRNRSAHGLRKAAARRLAEAGCSAKQIAAITGHKTLAEVERYTASADQERLARSAVSRMPSRENKT